MQPADLYKLAYQACLGSGHAVSDPQHARRWLEDELAQMGDGPDEPTYDPISPDRRILRIHLRPYLASGGDPEYLLQAFIRTANEFHGSTAALAACGEEMIQMAQAGQLTLEAQSIQQYFAEQQVLGYPAAHHSIIYQAHYRPAYRVVSKAYFGKSQRILG